MARVKGSRVWIGLLVVAALLTTLAIWGERNRREVVGLQARVSEAEERIAGMAPQAELESTVFV